MCDEDEEAKPSQRVEEREEGRHGDGAEPRASEYATCTAGMGISNGVVPEYHVKASPCGARACDWKQQHDADENRFLVDVVAGHEGAQGCRCHHLHRLRYHRAAPVMVSVANAVERKRQK